MHSRNQAVSRLTWVVALILATIVFPLRAVIVPVASAADGPARVLPPGDEPHPEVATGAIAAAMDDYPIVALGESHNLREAGEFYRQLISDRAFQAVADSIVVEFGNARYQSVIDHYVFGRRVPRSELRKVWQNTTQVGAWEAPMYAAFFRAVRRANSALPREAQLHVALGDPPIRWNHIESREDAERFLLRREPFLARVAEEEAFEEDRNVFLVAGLAHVQRIPGTSQTPNVTQLIESRHAGSVYVVGAHLGFPSIEWQSELLDWPVPSVAALADTWIGRLPKASAQAEDVINAMLYLGDPDSLHLSIPLPSVYHRSNYWRVLKHRWEISTGAPFSARALFGDFADAGYPGQFSQRGIATLHLFAECMRDHDVDIFPDPVLQYDAAGFYGEAIKEARQDPDFQAGFNSCAPLLDEA